MAAGDVKIALSSIASSSYLDVQPAVGEEWVIHNLHHAASAELYFSDGTNEILIASDSNQGSWLNFYLHVTRTLYLRIKNTHANAKYLGYDGVQTK